MELNMSVDKLIKKHKELGGFFEDCYECVVTEYEITKKLFYLLMSYGPYLGHKDTREYPEITEDNLAETVDAIIKLLKLDVNQPSFSGRQDMMYHAIRYCTAKEVEMLILNGYNCTNNIGGSGRSANSYILSSVPEFEEKSKIFKKYNLYDIKSADVSIYNEKYWNEFAATQASNIKKITNEELKKLQYFCPSAAAVLEEYKVLNNDKATIKLIDKLMKLGVSGDELKDILRVGHFYDIELYEDEILEYRPIYLKLLDSEGIERPADAPQKNQEFTNLSRR